MTFFYRHSEEIPKQINPYGTEEVFVVFNVSVWDPVRLQTAPTGPGGNQDYRINKLIFRK